jgi:hypothetical protein
MITPPAGNSAGGGPDDGDGGRYGRTTSWPGFPLHPPGRRVGIAGLADARGQRSGADEAAMATTRAEQPGFPLSSRGCRRRQTARVAAEDPRGPCPTRPARTTRCPASGLGGVRMTRRPEESRTTRVKKPSGVASDLPAWTLDGRASSSEGPTKAPHDDGVGGLRERPEAGTRG